MTQSERGIEGVSIKMIMVNGTFLLIYIGERGKSAGVEILFPLIYNDVACNYTYIIYLHYDVTAI